jgi:aminomethyltransferase
MMHSDDFGFGTQIRKSPFFDATVRWGAQGFSVYNHMYIPRDFGDPEQNFWTLVNDAILCDVGVERQVEITGPDAARFTQMLTPRDLSGMAVGQCKYVLITNAEGGILNDPICLRLGENHFDEIMDLRYYWLREMELDGIPLIVSRTGWSSELGYEIYLLDGTRGDALWERIMAVGLPFGLKPGHTSTIRRIEGGMLSYHADADMQTNPYELGLDRLVNPDMEAEFIGKFALRRIRDSGVTRKQVGLVINGPRLAGPNTRFWDVAQDGTTVGRVTSAVYSPRLDRNIALAMVSVDCANLGTQLDVTTPSGPVSATVVEKPFFDPRKERAVTDARVG